MTISLIVACARDGLIGRDNQLPWHLPRDLKRFRKLTWGKPIVMGRRTFESLGRPLEGRRNIVLTRHTDYRAEGAEVVHSVTEALALAAQEADAEVMIIGGGEVFREALPLADKVYLTTVEGDFEGDVRFPLETLSTGDWTVLEEESWPADAKNPHPQRFAILARNRAGDAPAC